MLKIFDSLSMKKLHFQTKTDHVKIFICGPTVYDYSHLGHARIFLFYDFVARYLLFKGWSPMIIVNITDIDPKISSKAKMEGVSEHDLSSRFIGELFIDLSLLGVDNSLNFARVSDYIETARELVSKLLERKLAYSKNGNIYLNTANVKSYGELSRMTRSELDNRRFDIAPGKYNSTDVLLWNTADMFGEMYYDPILGSGMPWWHLQDTSVAMSNFSGHYDIHGAAIELVYPHNESDLAQLKVLTSSDLPVKCWVHTGLVTIRGKKMSKSLGNAVTIRDLLKKYNSNVLRLYLFSKHYRDSIEFSMSKLDSFVDLDESIANAVFKEHNKFNKSNNEGSQKYMRKFVKHIEDDFDTPQALEIMADATKSESSIIALRNMVSIFGLRY
jgi:cysteinyl-tRNA synthetase